MTTNTELNTHPAQESVADSSPADPLRVACAGAAYPKLIIWPDVGEVVYYNADELYSELWARYMVREALALGGVAR